MVTSRWPLVANDANFFKQWMIIRAVELYQYLVFKDHRQTPDL